MVEGVKADGVSGSYSVRYVDLLVLSHQNIFQHLSLNFNDSAFGIPAVIYNLVGGHANLSCL